MVVVKDKPFLPAFDPFRSKSVSRLTSTFKLPFRSRRHGGTLKTGARVTEVHEANAGWSTPSGQSESPLNPPQRPLPPHDFQGFKHAESDSLAGHGNTHRVNNLPDLDLPGIDELMHQFVEPLGGKWLSGCKFITKIR